MALECWLNKVVGCVLLNLARFSLVVYTALAFALTSINASAGALIEQQNTAEDILAIGHSPMQDCHVNASSSAAVNIDGHALTHTMPIGGSCCTVTCMAPPLMNLLKLNIAESPSSLLAFSSTRSITLFNTAEPLYRPPIG